MPVRVSSDAVEVLVLDTSTPLARVSQDAIEVLTSIDNTTPATRAQTGKACNFPGLQDSVTPGFSRTYSSDRNILYQFTPARATSVTLHVNTKPGTGYLGVWDRTYRPGEQYVVNPTNGNDYTWNFTTEDSGRTFDVWYYSNGTYDGSLTGDVTVSFTERTLDGGGVSQYVVEALVSDTSTPVTRVSQDVLEVLTSSPEPRSGGGQHTSVSIT